MAKTVGLIAGMGKLPRFIAKDARERGYRVVAVGLDPVADDEGLEASVDVLERINVGKLDKVIKTLKRNGVAEAVMAGKVPKELLYKSRITPDLRAVKLLWTLKDRSDDTLLLAITGELEKDGIRLLETTSFCSGLLAPEGGITKRQPTKAQWKDIEWGFGMAKEIGRLDIGQTVVVKGQAVMAVEAIEGTDRAIKRGGKLAGGGAVVVKTAKPAQDLRFDVPAVGLSTVLAMIEAEAAVLAVEAGATLLLEKEKVLKEAEEAGIAIVGYTPRRR
ncbi:MAG: UDP-2,3-diacylglucosamine diphosphatase LpxI [Nitrospiraceae bacterium]|nr:UDP-2,3-diacylglucosamine diphosphatase LpxI [Nitrospiraceae bacterium]